MKCPYCAEEIQDAAIVCRFCGASKKDGEWAHPGAKAVASAAARGPTSPKGHFSMRAAAILLLLSAFIELFSIASPVPIFGAVREGFIAFFIHALDAAVMGVMGAGIYLRKPWGDRSVYVGTAIYTIEKLLYIFDRSARDAALMQTLKGYESVLPYVNKDALRSTETLVQVALILGWIGFAVWVYIRRDYFKSVVQAA